MKGNKRAWVLILKDFADMYQRRYAAAAATKSEFQDARCLKRFETPLCNISKHSLRLSIHNDLEQM